MTLLSKILKSLGQEHAYNLEKKLNKVINDLKNLLGEKEIRIETLEEMVMAQQKAHMEAIQDIKVTLDKVQEQLSVMGKKYDESILELQFTRAESQDWRERLEIIMTDNPHIKLSDVEKKRNRRNTKL